MKFETVSNATIIHYNQETELNIYTAAALWSDNTPPVIWPIDLSDLIEKFPNPGGFITQVRALTISIYEDKIAALKAFIGDSMLKKE